jgi:hypothetical protein
MLSSNLRFKKLQVMLYCNIRNGMLIMETMFEQARHLTCGSYE